VRCWHRVLFFPHIKIPLNRGVAAPPDALLDSDNAGFFPARSQLLDSSGNPLRGDDGTCHDLTSFVIAVITIITIIAVIMSWKSPFVEQAWRCGLVRGYASELGGSAAARQSSRNASMVAHDPSLHYFIKLSDAYHSTFAPLQLEYVCCSLNS
jgi:xanthine/uracil permease